MESVRIVRWLEFVSGLAAGVFGFIFVREVFFAFLVLGELPHYSPFDWGAAFRLGLVISALVLLSVGVAGAVLDGWKDRRIGRVLLWVGAIPLVVLAVIAGSPVLLPPALLLLLAGTFAMLAERLAPTPPPAR